MERWLCAHVIDGDVGQAMPHPCSSTYVGGSRSRLRARAGNGDAKSSGRSDEATETKRRCAAGTGSAYATATHVDEESGGPNPVKEEEDCISPSESDDICESSIGGSEASDGSFGEDQSAIFTESIRIEVGKAKDDADAPYIKKGCDKLRFCRCPIRFFSRKSQLRRHISSARCGWRERGLLLPGIPSREGAVQ